MQSIGRDIRSYLIPCTLFSYLSRPCLRHISSQSYTSPLADFQAYVCAGMGSGVYQANGAREAQQYVMKEGGPSEQVHSSCARERGFGGGVVSSWKVCRAQHSAKTGVVSHGRRQQCRWGCSGR